MVCPRIQYRKVCAFRYARAAPPPPAPRAHAGGASGAPLIIPSTHPRRDTSHDRTPLGHATRAVSVTHTYHIHRTHSYHTRRPHSRTSLRDREDTDPTVQAMSIWLDLRARPRTHPRPTISTLHAHAHIHAPPHSDQRPTHRHSPTYLYHDCVCWYTSMQTARESARALPRAPACCPATPQLRWGSVPAGARRDARPRARRVSIMHAASARLRQVDLRSVQREVHARW